MKFYRYFIPPIILALLLLFVGPHQQWRLNLFSAHSQNTSSFSRLKNNRQLEIEELQHRIAFLSLQLVQLQEKLQSLTTYREKFSLEKVPLVIPASIIMKRDIAANRMSFVVDRGSIHGVKPGLPVVFGCSLLGKVLETGTHTSRVLHIADPAMRIGVILIASSPTKINHYGEAVCYGQSQEFCYLKFVEKGYQKWEEPEITVLTSGLGNQFPPGLVVGTVSSPYKIPKDASENEVQDAGLFWNLKVKIMDIDTINTVLIIVQT